MVVCIIYLCKYVYIYICVYIYTYMCVNVPVLTFEHKCVEAALMLCDSHAVPESSTVMLSGRTTVFSSHPAALQICITKSTRAKMAPIARKLPCSYVVGTHDMHYCLAFDGHTRASNWSGLDPQEIAPYRHIIPPTRL